MIALPSLKRQIRRNFFAFLILYGILGIVLVISVLSASRTSPKMIHVNYDSIAAANRMKEAWDALAHPARYPQHTIKEWRELFESSLKFEEGNITEPGELEASRKLRDLWNGAVSRVREGMPESAVDLRDAQAIESLLDTIVTLNEKGMFGLAEENTNLSKRVLLFAVAYSLLTLILSIFLADGLAERLSRPLKRVAEVLQGRPRLDRPLKLPEPTNLELLILLQEIQHMWDRLSASAQINLEDLMVEKVKVDTILKSIEDALLVLDEEDTVVHCNDLFLALIGLPVEAIMNQRWQDVSTAGENYLKLRELLHRNLKDGSVIDLLVDSQKRTYAARWRNLRGIGGETAGSVFMLHDITEKRQKERFREEFIDLLSHELKTPLQSLGTASEILTENKKQLSSDLGLLVETIAEDVERIRAVASEFVQVSQSQSKVMKLKLQKTALNVSLQEWLKPFKLVAKDRDVRLEFRHEGSEDIFANIDSVKFPWVISNLVSNAIRYAPKGSLVEVFLTDRNGCVEINVQDEGSGVSLADQKKMFEPFYQGTGLGEVGRGLLGVGLTIAKEVVEAHDGRIEYYSRSPQGSIFRIVLPFPPYEYG